MNCSVAGSSAGLPQKERRLAGSRYSPTMCGRRGRAVLISRIQPHGQPKLGTVNFPYTSSTVSANGRPGTGTAECVSAHSIVQPPPSAVPHLGRFSIGVEQLVVQGQHPARRQVSGSHVRGVEHQEVVPQVGQVGAGSIHARCHRVQREVEVVVGWVGGARIELVPVALGDLGEAAVTGSAE